MALGEQPIHDVYYTLRNGPGWNETLLLITFDEHGGKTSDLLSPAHVSWRKTFRSASWTEPSSNPGGSDSP